MVTIRTVTCENPACGRIFESRRSDGRVVRFCCRACCGASRRQAQPGYIARHARMRKIRGRARDLPCVDCGGPAREWSQRRDTDGLDPFDYDPRCPPCHRAYDGHKLRPGSGESNHNAKLTWEQVREIRALRGTVPHRVLAERYGVSRPVISRLLEGAMWIEPPST